MLLGVRWDVAGFAGGWRDLVTSPSPRSVSGSDKYFTSRLRHLGTSVPTPTATLFWKFVCWDGGITRQRDPGPLQVLFICISTHRPRRHSSIYVKMEGSLEFFWMLMKISFTASFNKCIQNANSFKHFSDLGSTNNTVRTEIHSSSMKIFWGSCWATRLLFFMYYKLWIFNWLQSTNSLAKKEIILSKVCFVRQIAKLRCQRGLIRNKILSCNLWTRSTEQ